MSEAAMRQLGVPEPVEVWCTWLGCGGVLTGAGRAWCPPPGCCVCLHGNNVVPRAYRSVLFMGGRGAVEYVMPSNGPVWCPQGCRVWCGAHMGLVLGGAWPWRSSRHHGLVSRTGVMYGQKALA